MEPREEIAADAALFALGQLDEPAKSRFEARLKEGCPIARSEYATFLETTAALGLADPFQAPPATLRDRLMRHIASEVSATPGSGRVIVRREEQSWQPGPAPGVEIRLLNTPKTMLVRLAPGAHVPAHHHGSAEQCLVIEGTVTDGELTVGAGDYIFMPAGSSHNELWSDSGCTFLIVYA